MKDYLSTLFDTIRSFNSKPKKNQNQANKGNSSNKAYSLEGLFVKPVRIYMDTCSLLQKNSVQFMDEIARVAIRKNQKITLFKSVIRELQKVSTEQPHMQNKVNRIICKLYELKERHLLEMIEGSEKFFSDPNFLEAVIRDIRTMNVVIISNDKKLVTAAKNISKDILPAVHTEYVLKVKSV